MKKVLLILALAVLLATPAFASVGLKVNGVMYGTATDLNIGCGSGVSALVTNDGSVYNLECSPNIFNAGVANGAAVSFTTGGLGVPTTAGAIVLQITSTVGQTASLGPAVPGQIISIFVSSVSGSGTMAIIPSKATGFYGVNFTAAKQIATLLYLNDTAGWILLSVVGANIQ